MEKIIRWLILILIGLLPLFFLPLTPNPFDFNKKALFLFGIGFILILWAVDFLLRKKIRLSFPPFGLPLVALALAFIISLLFSAGQKSEALLGQTSTFLSLIVFYFLLFNFFQRSDPGSKEVHDPGSPPNTGSQVANDTGSKQTYDPVSKAFNHLVFAFLIPVFLLSWLVIFDFIGVFQQLAPWEFLKVPFFSPAGSFLGCGSLLLVSLPFLIIYLFNEHSTSKVKSANFTSEVKSVDTSEVSDPQSKDPIKRIALGSTLLLNIVALGLMTTKLIQGKVNVFILPLRFGWQIAIQSLQNFPLFGIGPENFITAFSLFRGASFNLLNNLWNFYFFTSSNLYLELLTTTGLLGFGALVFLVWEVGRKLVTEVRTYSDPGSVRSYDPGSFHEVSSGSFKAASASLAMAFFLTFLIPPNFLLLFSLFFFLGLVSLASTAVPPSSEDDQSSFNLATSEEGLTKRTSEVDKETSEVKEALRGEGTIPGLVLALVLLLIGPLIFFEGKAWAAEYFYYKSLKAAAKNLGKETYEFQQRAIQFNQRRDIYRISYSQTNLALANSLAGKADLSDQERQTITQLIQQAIREARIATQLSPQKVQTWQNLANIYQNLTGFAQGAENWTIANYLEAIRRDPSNPQLRILLGQIYYSFNDFEGAIEQFRWAVRLKPDFANGFYNLAYAYKGEDKLARAAWTMEQARIIVCDLNADSEVCRKTTDEAKELAELVSLASPTGEPEAELEEEVEAATPAAEPQEPLGLPSPAGTPAAEITPIVLPSPEPSPSPSPTPSPTPTPG